MNRSADLALAGLGLIVSAPALAVAAAVVKLTDGGPVLYRQQRVGKDEYPWRNPSEQRIKVRITAEKVEATGLGD